MAELMIDVITSLDGYAPADGWPGLWGLGGPDYLAWLEEDGQIDLFPVVTGVTGRERVYDDWPDVGLDLIESRTFDGRSQLLDYRPDYWTVRSAAAPPATSERFLVRLMVNTQVSVDGVYLSNGYQSNGGRHPWRRPPFDGPVAGVRGRRLLDDGRMRRKDGPTKACHGHLHGDTTSRSASSPITMWDMNHEAGEGHDDGWIGSQCGHHPSLAGGDPTSIRRKSPREKEREI